MVGPQVGKDLREKALFAMFYALLFITIYISGRFELKWVISAVMAGALIGAVYFLSLFNVSIPFLIIAAIIVSLAVVRSNSLTMLVWAGVIAVTLFAAMLPAFLGLLVALPVLGHATWHRYRRAVCDPA